MLKKITPLFLQPAVIIFLLSSAVAQFPGDGDILEIHESVVFRTGESEYGFFRIPSLLIAGHDLIAFSEGRKNSLSDHGRIDIVMKKSSDHGKTWGDMIIVTSLEGVSCQNPTPVYVEEEKKMILLFTKRTISSDTESMIRAGSASGYVGAYSTTSYDQGLTWSPVREITGAVKKESWRWYAFGPGGAIRMKQPGKNTGRIIIPANHSTDGGEENEFLGAHIVYSDDNGITWKIGATDSEGFGSVNPNELTLAETTHGTLYFNSRSQNHSSDPLSNRAITYSADGGITFVRKFFHEPQLITPVVHCSLTNSRNKFIFVGPNDREQRKNLSFWISQDETLTWQGPWLIQEGPAAYSSTIGLKKGKIGILYENGEESPYEQIRFKLVKIE